MLFEVELNKKTYRVNSVPVKVVRAMGPAQEVYQRLLEDPSNINVEKDIDTLVNWFVLFCGNQFTADDVYDYYPGDRIITDVGLAMAALNTSVEKVLKKFPTGQGTKKKEAPETLSRKFTGIISKLVNRWRR
jgi:hypothetical protein